VSTLIRKKQPELVKAMFDVKTQFEDSSKQVITAAEKEIDRALQRTSYAISQDAKASIKNAPPAAGGGSRRSRRRKGKRQNSRPGQAPLTRGIPRKNLRAAIGYSVDKVSDTAVIGTRYSMVGDVGGALELGEDRPSTSDNENIDARPFMGPALDRNAPLFGPAFQGGIGQGG
jgi:phage gpG-like protein